MGGVSPEDHAFKRNHPDLTEATGLVSASPHLILILILCLTLHPQLRQDWLIESGPRSPRRSQDGPRISAPLPLPLSTTAMITVHFSTSASLDQGLMTTPRRRALCRHPAMMNPPAPTPTSSLRIRNTASPMLSMAYVIVTILDLSTPRRSTLTTWAARSTRNLLSSGTRSCSRRVHSETPTPLAPRKFFLVLFTIGYHGQDLNKRLIPYVSYRSARSAASADAARTAVLNFFNAGDDYTVIFTANASSALKLVGESFPFTSTSHYVLGEDSHNSVHGIRQYAAQSGAEVAYIPATSTGGFERSLAEVGL
jgi:hypothetical protein